MSSYDVPPQVVPGEMRWQGSSYDRISGPQEVMGRAVLERLELRGGEAVLDAGCGTGRVTEGLLGRLPRGRVIAVDASASMLEAAAQRLGSAHSDRRIQLRQVDLIDVSLAGLGLDDPLDAVFSTATFHWIADHQCLFERLHGLLAPDGQLVAQCGGKGNIGGLRSLAMKILAREPYAQDFLGWAGPWNYATPEATEQRLRQAGFSSARAWLEPSPQQPQEPREFLRTIVFAPHLRRLRADLRERFMDELMNALGEPVIVDFVRLNIDARA